MIPILLFLNANIEGYYKYASRGRQSLEGLQCNILVLSLTECNTYKYMYH